MPIREYVCKACGETIERLQRLSDEPLTDCPSCGESALEKKISAVAFRLSGSGWYETDFKSDRRRNVSADNESSESASEQSSDKDDKSGSESSGQDASTKSGGEKAAGADSSQSKESKSAHKDSSGKPGSGKPDSSGAGSKTSAQPGSGSDA